MTFIKRTKKKQYINKRCVVTCFAFYFFLLNLQHMFKTKKLKNIKNKMVDIYFRD